MIYTLSTHAIDTIRERKIRPEWITATMTKPVMTEPDQDDATLTHALQVIPEYGDRVLRVIYNHTKHPPHIVTVFFDRGMKGKL